MGSSQMTITVLLLELLNAELHLCLLCLLLSFPLPDDQHVELDQMMITPPHTEAILEM